MSTGDGTEDIAVNQIETAQSPAGDVSNITEPTPAPVGPVEPPESPQDIGVPAAPARRALTMPDVRLFEEGYDTDRNEGPFEQSGVDNEQFASMDEEVQDVEIAPEPAAEGGESGSPESVLDEEKMRSMKVVELREELKRRALSVKGKKEELFNRLKEAVENNVPVVENQTEEVLQNLADENFRPGSHWVLMEPDGEELGDERNMMTVEGVSFHAPTVPREEHEAANDGSAVQPPKKRNYSEVFDRPPFVSQRVLLPEKRPNGTFKKKRLMVLMNLFIL